MKQGSLSTLSPAGIKHSLRHLLYASSLYRMTLKGRAPENLKLTPPSFRLGDPKSGRAIVDGTFVLAHHPVKLGQNPWMTPSGDKRTLTELHGFSWLADLFAAGSDKARERASELLCGWIEQNNKWDEVSWRPDVVGERLSNWLSFFDFLTLEQEKTKTALLEMAMIQARHLGHSCAHAPDDSRFFKALHGLIFSAVCLPGAERLLDDAFVFLEREISRQIYPDGGHIERNPSYTVELLSRFNQIRALLIAAHIEVPASLQGAIDRMPPMVRALRHGDGGLALFNGGFEEDRTLIDRTLAETGVRGKALNSAPHSGFQRLSAGRTTIIVDTGGPSQVKDCTAHAGALSFEMSVGKERLIVNCGAPASEGEHWHTAMQATAAHSTLAVDDKNSAQPLDDGSHGLTALNVACARHEADGSAWLELSHDGYQQTVGVVHHRNLYLEASGEDFRGEDIVEGSGGRHYAVRFHLHPDVHASQVQGKSTILLKLAKGPGWEFQASGGSVNLEESVYLSGHGEARRSEQIIVSAPLHGDGAQVKWRLHRI